MVSLRAFGEIRRFYNTFSFAPVPHPAVFVHRYVVTLYCGVKCRMTSDSVIISRSSTFRVYFKYLRTSPLQAPRRIGNCQVRPTNLEADATLLWPIYGT